MKTRLNYKLEIMKSDLEKLSNEIDVYASMLVEAEVIKREGGHAGMHFEKVKQMKQRINQRLELALIYLDTMQEIDETQKLLYTKEKKHND